MLKLLDQLMALCPQARQYFGNDTDAAVRRARAMVRVEFSGRVPAELREYYTTVINLFTCRRRL